MTHELPPTARVLAFPTARNAQAIDRLLKAYVALWRRHGYAKARGIFEARELAPMRARLRAIGVPVAEAEREVHAVTIAMRRLYDGWIGARVEHTA